MANLIIKPTSGGSLILQDEGGTAAHTIDASGNHTLSGTTNNLGTVTAGTISNAVTGVNQKIFGFSARLSTAKAVTNNAWTEINTVWTEYFDTDSKFGTTTGRFTPTVAGVYHCGFVIDIDELDDTERIIGAIRLNSTSTNTTHEFAKFQNRSPVTDGAITAGASGLIVLDADDYVSTWCYQNSGGNADINVGSSKFWGYYVGTV